MQAVIKYLCSQGKGILAADESIGTIGKRFDTIYLENNHENRERYRDMLFSTNGIEDHISGIITFEETLNNNGLRKHLYDKGILVGVKTDQGLVDIPFTNQKTTKGMDTLEERSKDYYVTGARFSKWRCVFYTQNLSDEVIEKNTRLLAEYALISQLSGLVPIVEPEVLVDGALNIQRVEQVTKKVLTRLFYNLNTLNVRLDLMILKPNMIRTNTSTTHEVARRTVEVLKETVPCKVPGIAFLSGGMNEVDSIHCLKLMNEIGGPWRLTFSFGRALQSRALKKWGGVDENKDIAQNELLDASRNAADVVN